MILWYIVNATKVVVTFDRWVFIHSQGCVHTLDYCELDSKHAPSSSSVGHPTSGLASFGFVSALRGMRLFAALHGSGFSPPQACGEGLVFRAPVREDWLSSKEDLVWSKLMHSIGGASIHEIDGRGCHFGPIEVRHVLLTHHGAYYLQYLPILPFGYSNLLGCVLARKFSPYSLTLKIVDEFVGEVLLSSIRS